MIINTKFEIDTVFYVPKSTRRYVLDNIIIDDIQYTNETITYEPYVRTKKIVSIEGFFRNDKTEVTYRVVNVNDDGTLDSFKYYFSEDAIESCIEYTHDGALVFAIDAANKKMPLY